MRASVAAKSVAETRALLVGLTLQAFEQLRLAKQRKRAFPALHSSGVRYRREQRDSDDWKPPARVLADGHGDCEDLVAWRCAELWLAGIKASPEIRQVRPGLKHAFLFAWVKRAGKLVKIKLDPSKWLGMGKP